MSPNKFEPPNFIERFEEVVVKQNEPIKLVAKVTGVPIPKVAWLHNNLPLRKSDNITSKYDGQNIELIIKNADSEINSGDYKCIASNLVGKASHGSKITVDVEEVTFTKKLAPLYTAEENKTITLECETSHTVSTKWFHDGKELSGMDHRVIVQEGHVHKLFIKNALFKDVGNYTCTVKDQKTTSELVVTEAKPDFVRKLTDFEINEQELAILEVEITSDKADVSWYKDGTPVQPDGKRIIYVKKNKIRKLIIKEVSVYDEGEYICVLADQECSGEMIVIELPPEILTKLEDLTIAQGEKATFEIELTKGDALVRWFKDDEEIQFSDHVQLRIDGKKQRLKIYDALLEDAGEYSCIVGDLTSTAKLTVEEPLVEFIRKLPDISLVTKENDIEFIAELSQPNIKVVWYKNTEVIENSRKYQIIDENTVKKLIIKNCQEPDAETYTCVAYNVKTTTKLKVETIKTPPVILVEDVEKTFKVQEDDDLEVNIRFNASPKPTVEFDVEDVTVKETRRIKKTITEQSASLTIRRIQETDAGVYNVNIKNVSGEASTYFTVVFMSKIINYSTALFQFLINYICVFLRTSWPTWQTRTG